VGSLLARSASAGRLVIETPAIGRRFDPRMEAAAYFCAAEAARHMDGPVVVTLSASDQRLRLILTGADPSGLPIRHMRDRVEAAGGSLTVTGAAEHTVVRIHQ
jgi:signal transduction histidine kinase